MDGPPGYWNRGVSPRSPARSDVAATLIGACAAAATTGPATGAREPAKDGEATVRRAVGGAVVVVVVGGAAVTTGRAIVVRVARTGGETAPELAQPDAATARAANPGQTRRAGNLK